jgi:hypothetical protein
MSNDFFVSFNSPQCGFMSIGFEGGGQKFSTTTAHSPHNRALSLLLKTLTDLLDENSVGLEFLVQWNRDPEEFDFWFAHLDENQVRFEIWQYPTGRGVNAEREKVFVYAGDTLQFCQAFEATFEQMNKDKETDAFEQNWRQPFPSEDFRKFNQVLQNARQSS